jgi:hypothetical protein
MQIQTIEPPVVADEAAGIKGRVNYKIILSDGSKCFAAPDLGATLVAGQEYGSMLTLNEGNFGNMFLNKANGTASQPAQSAPQATAQAAPNPASNVNQTPANIFIQGMTQQAIASGVHDPVAVYQWAVDNYPNFVARKPMSPFPGMEPALAPHVPATGAPVVPEPTGEPMNDPIPF